MIKWGEQVIGAKRPGFWQTGLPEVPYVNFFLSSNKFSFANNIWACLYANITIHNVTGIINEPLKLDFLTSWNLCFSALEPGSLSVFWLDTYVRQASFNRFIFSERRFCIFPIVVACKRWKYVILNVNVWVNCAV